MTYKQKQCLLNYLGYDTGGVDGIWGDKSRQATEAFQRDYQLIVDGVFGAETEKRILEVIATGEQPKESVQIDTGPVSDAAAYLQADGYYHIPRGVDVQLSRNLWAHEIHCQGKGCCTESIVSKRMVDMFQIIRDDFGEPIEIATADGSGFRCHTHNTKVGGAVASLHLTGDAFDLHARDKERLSKVEQRTSDLETGNAEILEALEMILTGVTE